jgi:nitroreductase
MTEALNNLKTRRSTSFPLMGSEAPTKAEITEILTIASRVPDHGKLAPWRFIVIGRNEALGEALATLIGGDDEARLKLERGRFTRAPLCIAVVSKVQPHAKIPEWEQILSSGAACTQILNACQALGYGATWITEWLAYDDRVKELFGLEAHERFAGFIHIGKQTGKPDDRPRPDLADIVTYL